MQFEDEFKVAAGVDEAWALLVDVPRIATCLPGATVEDTSGEEYQGSVTIKVGPIKVVYQGIASFAEIDESRHRFVLNAKGKEASGKGSAAAVVTVQLEEVGLDKTLVRVVTELEITGKVAQFGRSAMADVGERLVGQFASNLEASFFPSRPATGAGEAAAAPTTTQPGGSTTAGQDLDALVLVMPLLKRAAPALGGFALGFGLGLLVRRSR